MNSRPGSNFAFTQMLDFYLTASGQWLFGKHRVSAPMPCLGTTDVTQPHPFNVRKFLAIKQIGQENMSKYGHRVWIWDRLISFCLVFSLGFPLLKQKAWDFPQRYIPDPYSWYGCQARPPTQKQNWHEGPLKIHTRPLRSGIVLGVDPHLFSFGFISCF